MSVVPEAILPRPPRTIGRYQVGAELAAGGMAAIHVGRVVGAGGFSRVVAVKRMLPHLAGLSSFALMFTDEARLAAQVRHPNVVPTFDVVREGAELCIVMEYVQGLTLAELLKLCRLRHERVPTPVALAVIRDALQGLHAAHEAVDADGNPLGIVHRDVSPQNILVGVDGIARVLDFGIAKANVRLHQTRSGDGLKGKFAYIAPEQFEGHLADRRSDIYSCAVVLWETLTARRLHEAETEAAIMKRVLDGAALPPSHVEPELGSGYDVVVMRGLARDARARFPTAREMAIALAESGPVAPAAHVGEWVERIAGDVLAQRAARVRAFEDHPAPSGSALVGDPEATAAAIAASPAVVSSEDARTSTDVGARVRGREGASLRRGRAAVLVALVGVVSSGLFLGGRALLAPPRSRGVESVAVSTPAPAPVAPDVEPAPAATLAVPLPPPTPSTSAAASAAGSTRRAPPRPAARTTRTPSRPMPAALPDHL